MNDQRELAMLPISFQMEICFSEVKTYNCNGLRTMYQICKYIQLLLSFFFKSTMNVYFPVFGLSLQRYIYHIAKKLRILNNVAAYPMPSFTL